VNALGEILMILGSCFALLAAIGIHRFPDVYSRMHAAAKSPTLGLVLVALGAGVRIWTLAATTTLVLVVVLQLLTAPVATNVTARAVHLTTRVPLDGDDELARDEAAGRSVGVPDPDED
jgi:multicomponent Na+:H+ antiporter subunit G